MSMIKKSILIAIAMTIIAMIVLVVFQLKNKDETVEVVKEIITTNEIITNLSSEHMVKVQYTFEVSSKEVKEEIQKYASVIESDIIKILSQTKREEMKNIIGLEEKIKQKADERFGKGNIIKVYTVKQLVQ